jgi:hypothetical protein
MCIAAETSAGSEKTVEENAKEPGAGIGAGLELMEILPGQKKTVLHEVFGVGRVRCQPTGDT